MDQIIWFPKETISDNGRQFISTEFKNFLSDNKINHILTSGYNPTGNSRVERINKEIGEAIRLSKGLTLKKLEENIRRRLNLNTKRSIKFPPFDVFFNTGFFSNAKLKKIINREIIMKINHDKTKENIKKNNLKRKKVNYKVVI
ncbi:Gag-Pro-Pol polyprotein [Dictyocoela muelleri]|nr:Gag-Pro-Pol polyprotein [Dictyocoela muelleri]